MATPLTLSPWLTRVDKNVEIDKQVLVTFTALLFWDYLATLPQEIRLMWGSRDRSLLKVLFFANRYYTLFTLACSATFWFGTISVDACNRAFWLLRLNPVVVTLLTDGILSIRVFAIWERRPSMAVALSVGLAAEIALMSFASAYYQPYILPPGFGRFVTFNGCFTTPSVGHLHLIPVLFYAPSLLFNTVILLLTVLRSVSVERKVGKLPLLASLRNAGCAYFFTVVVVNAIALGFNTKINPSLSSVANPASIVLTSVACSHLVLDLRSHSLKPRPTANLQRFIVADETRYSG